MKKNKSLLIIAVLLAMVSGFLLMQNHYTTLKVNESSFSIKDTASITKIFIADKNVNSVLLKRTDKGWVLNDEYDANNKIVNTLLSTMKRLKVKSPVSIASHDNVVSRLASIGKKVEVYQEVYRIDIFGIKLFKHEKLTKVFYVGDVTKDNLGTYMLVEGSEQPYVVFLPGFRGFVSNRFSPLLDDWISHIVFKNTLADIKSIKIYFAEDENMGFQVDVKDELGNYDLIRLSDNSKLDTYDTLKVLNLMTSFSDLRYESRLNNLIPIQRIDSVLNSPSLYEITLVDNNLDTTFVKMFKKNRVPDAVSKMYDVLTPVDHDRCYGLVNDGNDFVLLQYYIFDRVLYPLSHYQN